MFHSSWNWDEWHNYHIHINYVHWHPSGLNSEGALKYRICANKPPLLIKPPPIQNSNKPPLFCPKSPLFGAFLGKFWKNFNKPPPQNLDFFIDRWRFIDTDRVW